MDKHAFLNIAVIAALSGVLSIGYSIYIVNGGLETFCEVFGTPYQDGFYRHIKSQEWHCPQNQRTRIYLSFTGGLSSLVVSVILFIFRDKFKRRTLLAETTRQQMIVPKAAQTLSKTDANEGAGGNLSPTVSRGDDDDRSLHNFNIGEFEIGDKLEQNDEFTMDHPDLVVEIFVGGNENDDHSVTDKV
jgi:hypothetical protein